MIKNDQKGMALLLVLTVISVLVVVTLQFYKAMYQHYASSVTYSEIAQLDLVAFSGTNFGISLLEEDRQSNEFDALFEDWAVLDQSKMSGLFDQESLNVKIQDLSGRIQLNSLVGRGDGQELVKSKKRAIALREILVRLLLSDAIGVEGENEATSIVDAMVEWLNTENSDRMCSDSAYCQSLENAYDSNKKRFLYLEQLLLIHGITKDIFYGDGDEKIGLKNVVTLYGDDGKININTAPIEVIKALNPLISQDIADDFDDYRQNEENEDSLLKSKWYQALNSWSENISLPELVLTRQSFFFRIIASGSFRDMERSTITYVYRDDDGTVIQLCKIVE